MQYIYNINININIYNINIYIYVRPVSLLHFLGENKPVPGSWWRFFFFLLSLVAKGTNSACSSSSSCRPRCRQAVYPLVMSKWLLKMAIEIVDFPIKNGGSFHSYVSLPEGN